MESNIIKAYMLPNCRSITLLPLLFVLVFHIQYICHSLDIKPKRCYDLVIDNML
jgi:hypothetical protein